MNWKQQPASPLKKMVVDGRKPIVAAFDFDGTITSRDSLLSFLFFTAGTWRTVQKLAALSTKMTGYLLNYYSRQETKESILTSFFAGLPISQLRELGESFSRSSSLSSLIRPEALKRIAWHRQQQHSCVLVSAGIDIYLEPWGKLMGFEDVISSRLEVTSKNIVSGHLQGLNCWGKEKVRRLEEKWGPHEQFILYAYGDSRGDKELLAAADYPLFRSFSSMTS